MGKFVGLALIGYLIYEWWQGQQSPLTAVATGAGIPVTVPTPSPAQMGPPWYSQQGCTQIGGQFTPAPAGVGAPSGYGNCTNVPANAPAQPAPSGPGPTIVVVPTGALRTQLLSAANHGYNAMVQGGGDSILLDVDEWAYWYHSITGQLDEGTATGGSQADQIRSFIGASRDTLVSVDQFISGLHQVGLSGLRGLGYLPDGPVPTISLPSRVVNTGIGNQHLPYEMAYAGHGIGLEGLDGAGRGRMMAVATGLGRSYNSGFGILGQGYGINETRDGDASRYEMASKWIM